MVKPILRSHENGVKMFYEAKKVFGTNALQCHCILIYILFLFARENLQLLIGGGSHKFRAMQSVVTA
jgi:hypothetical protein